MDLLLALWRLCATFIECFPINFLLNDVFPPSILSGPYILGSGGMGWGRETAGGSLWRHANFIQFLGCSCGTHTLTAPGCPTKQSVHPPTLPSTILFCFSYNHIFVFFPQFWAGQEEPCKVAEKLLVLRTHPTCRGKTDKNPLD